jgi:predicted metal-dependent phosphoesterase TrpH
VKTAIKKKLSGIAVTDHNTIKGGLKTIKYQNNDFQVIVGSEINTDRGEVIGLFLTEEIKSNTFIDVTEVMELISKKRMSNQWISWRFLTPVVYFKNIMIKPVNLPWQII